ncbi:DNA topoisomerase I [Planctopirus limnophila DSM 3776]|uniref:DNA topoisomerase 1 n=1 Tax=Planctopirus limnophila (strain ATCC 43296 / DSM 3776 / IFAM 1008 / Mu 290) TaxID=521674 RepID=D5SMX1_PLAL2|nr:type I DNA topoisomerase [Planctopirus limnophila]ADG68026.1 DNA topoisomerase I [Planctopirus limnophila DSM 3776]
MAAKQHKALVIVESPAKARKIGEYLGKDYIVLASMGHVRDLPSGAAEVPAELKKEQWATLGVNIDQQFEPVYVVPKDKKKTVKELKDALKTCSELILATDEDREGESIGWHLMKLLEPKVPVSRMVFSEITKDAIQKAIRNTRELDQNLVEAQETRRVVDRLYGYRLSPLLWKKVAPRLSAGRVQSVAVRVLVRREMERLAFRKGSYWDLKAALATASSARFDAALATVGGRRVAQGRDFDESTGRLKTDADVLLLDEAQSKALQTKLEESPDWVVSNVETRLQTRKPYPPFTTSTLQQEANRKLGLSARETMQIAQRLYENGFITYMRTDSVSLSQEAISASRACVTNRYGQEFLHPEVRQYTTKSKSAQEAHEAIRPAGVEMKTAEELSLNGREGALYAMIWKRTVATQMAEAQLRFQTVTIGTLDVEFRATGRHVEFAGFFRAYVEGSDDPEGALEDSEAALPPMEKGQKLTCKEVQALAHETKPPARYTEATLVKTLEEEGIGRPSTYASIIGTIQDRGYVRKQGNQLVPTFTAMAVTKLLEKNFSRLVDLQFTARMEQDLDDIANGQAERLPYLKSFYSGETGLDEQVKQNEAGIDPREACTLDIDGVNAKVRLGKFGAFFEGERDGQPVTATIPDDIAPADLTNELAEKLITQKSQGPQSLGIDPESGLPIFLLIGPFGPYLQLGEMKDGEKPRRVSIPKTRDVSTVKLEDALEYMKLPKALGPHPETGKVVKAGIGMYGPYVHHDKTYKSLDKTDDILQMTMERALELLAQARVRVPVAPLKELGAHPVDGDPVQIFEGKYGPYIKHGKTNATIPKERELDSVTLEEAVRLLDERVAKGGGSTGRRGGKKVTKKAAAKKAAASAAMATPKKATAKKKAAKKATKKSVS